MARTAMFEGLVVDQRGRATGVKYVGQDACYVVDDDGFLRHIDAASVDRQVLAFLKGQVDEHREVAVDGVLQMMGKDDLFTKVAVESSIDKMDEAVGQPIPTEARQWLGMLGFRIIIDERGQVVDIELPAGGSEGDDRDY